MRVKFLQDLIDIIRFKNVKAHLSCNVAALRAVLNIIDIFSYGNHKLKQKILRFCGAKIGNGCCIGTNLYIYNTCNLEVADNVGIGDNNTMCGWNKIKVGKYSFTSSNVCFLAGSHTTEDYCNISNQDISIGKGVWIGGNVTILGGADIGNGCIIGAGSVVLGKKYLSFKIIAGNPARIIKDRVIKNMIKMPVEYSIEELNNG